MESSRWLAGCNSLCACQLRQTGVPHLTTLLETAAVPTVATVATGIDAPARPRKRGWLPVLTVLFLISYGLMTMLIVEQGATIESQRALLRELYRDSEELSALRVKAQQEKSVADAQHHGQAAKSKTSVTQNPSTQVPMTQTPSTQIPSAQAPASTTPSSQAAQQHRTKNQTENRSPSSRCRPSRRRT